MASQVVNGSEELQVLEINSYIRGYHAYQDVWTPVLNESLLVKREPNNIIDSNAVAVYQDDLIVGHVPYNLAPSFSFFCREKSTGVQDKDWKFLASTVYMDLKGT